MARSEYSEGWKNLRLSRIGISLLEHIIQPVIGEKTIDLIREPVEIRQVVNQVFEALRITEENLILTFGADDARDLLALDLEDADDIRQPLLAFYDNPVDRQLETILLERLAQKPGRLSAERAREIIPVFLNTLRNNLIAHTSSEFREKVMAASLLEVRDSSEKTVLELRQIRQLLGEFLTAARTRPALLPSPDQAPSSLQDCLRAVVEDPANNYAAELDGRERAHFFVGRENELQQILSEYDRAMREGLSRFVLIQGDFGTGKTSLLGKFYLSAPPMPPHLFVWTRCPDREDFSGLAPFIRLTRLLIKKVFIAGLFTYAELAALLQDAPAWIKLALPNAGDCQTNTSNLSQEIINAQFHKFLGRILERVKLTVILDDIQWADISSLQLLSYLSAELADRPLLFLAAYRTEGLNNNEQLQRTRQDILAGQNSEIELTKGIDIRQYIRTRYQSDIVPDAVIEKIEKYSDGHALFIHQLFDHWQHQGILLKDPAGRWCFSTGVIKELEIPHSVEGVLDIRAQHMKAEYRNLLTLASVEGDDFSVQVLSRLADMDEYMLGTTLQTISDSYRLIGAKGVEFTPEFTFDFYQFMHRFFREFFYGKFSTSSKRPLHRKIGEYLETLPAESSNLYSRLAYHFTQAGVFDKSIRYSLLAAQEAFDNFKWVEAIEYCKRVCDRFTGMPAKTLSARKDYLETLAQSLTLWVMALEYVGGFDVDEDLIYKVSEDLRNFPELSLTRARLLLALARLYYYDNNENGGKVTKEAIEIFIAHGDKDGEYRAKRLLADFLTDIYNRFDEGIRLQEELIDLAGQYINPNEKIQNIAFLAWDLLYLGKYDEAVAHAGEAHQLCLDLRCHDLTTLATVSRMAGYTYYKFGHLALARKHQTESVQKFRQLGDTISEYWVRLELGYTLQALGEFESAIQEYDKCLTWAQAKDDQSVQEWINITLAKISIRQGALDVAGGYIKTAGDLLDKYDGSPEDVITYNVALADLLLAQNNLAALPPVLEKIAETLEVYHSDMFRAQYLNLQARAEYARGNVAAALATLNQSLALCRGLNAHVPTAITCDILRRMALEQNQPERARAYEAMARAHLRACNSPWSVEDLQGQMIEWIF